MVGDIFERGDLAFPKSLAMHIKHSGPNGLTAEPSSA